MVDINNWRKSTFYTDVLFYWRNVWWYKWHFWKLGKHRKNETFPGNLRKGKLMNAVLLIGWLSLGYHVAGSSLMIEWLSPYCGSFLQERRAKGIDNHWNMVSLWEALVWLLSDWVTNGVLFHRSEEPQVSAITGTWCSCERLLSDDWVIESLMWFYSTGTKSHRYGLPWECGFRVGGSCLMIQWLSV
jgi:hypothetical protein